MAYIPVTLLMLLRHNEGNVPQPLDRLINRVSNLANLANLANLSNLPGRK